jgi:two-component sensor histidine kinase
MSPDMKRSCLLSVFLLSYWIGTAQQKCDCELLTQKDQSNVSITALLQSDNPVCKSRGVTRMALELLEKDRIDSAEILLQNAISLLAKNNCESSAYLDNYKLLANVYSFQGDYEKQLENEFRIADIIEVNKDTVARAISSLNIARIFNEMKQYEKGMIYTRNALPFIAGIKASERKADLYSKLSARFLVFYNQINTSSLLDSAESFARAALKIADSIPVKRKIILFTNSKLVEAALARKDFENAIMLINKNFLLCHYDTDYTELCENFSNKAKVYNATGDYPAAKRYADSALIYAKLNQSPPMIAHIYSILYDIATKANNPKDALQAYQQQRTISDSLEQEAKVKAINLLEKKYNQARNEKAIRELSQQKQIYLLIILAALLALIAIGFWIRQLSFKHRQTVLEAEQRLNRARMNPHFLFNGLATLQSFAVVDRNPDAVAAGLSKFSHIVRETLESTYHEYVTIEKEIEYLNDYLDLHKNHFRKNFCFEIITAKNLEIDEMLIPSMIIEPFVENSIAHGFNQIDYPGKIIISFSRTEKNLEITITDNGAGLNTSKDNTDHISRATQIIKDRIFLLNSKLNTKASFSINNLQGEGGVTVKILLPLLFINGS